MSINAINNYGALNAYTKAAGGQPYGANQNSIFAQNNTINPFSFPTESIGVSGAKHAPASGKISHANDLGEVASIGYNKAQGFYNGLGGTNNPDDHKLFLVG